MCFIELEGQTLVYVFHRHDEAKDSKFGFNKNFSESCSEKITSCKVVSLHFHYRDLFHFHFCEMFLKVGGQ